MTTAVLVWTAFAFSFGVTAVALGAVLWFIRLVMAGAPAVLLSIGLGTLLFSAVRDVAP